MSDATPRRLAAVAILVALAAAIIVIVAASQDDEESSRAPAQSAPDAQPPSPVELEQKAFSRMRDDCRPWSEPGCGKAVIRYFAGIDIRSEAITRPAKEQEYRAIVGSCCPPGTWRTLKCRTAVVTYFANRDSWIRG